MSSSLTTFRLALRPRQCLSQLKAPSRRGITTIAMASSAPVSLPINRSRPSTVLRSAASRPTTTFPAPTLCCFGSGMVRKKKPRLSGTQVAANKLRNKQMLEKLNSKRPSRGRLDPRVRYIRYHMAHPATPRPLRFSRTRALRHWTIHRAWMLTRRQERDRARHELWRLHQSMSHACDALRALDAPSSPHAGRLYRRAMERDIWGADSIPMEYARAQTDTPAMTDAEARAEAAAVAAEQEALEAEEGEGERALKGVSAKARKGTEGLGIVEGMGVWNFGWKRVEA